MDQAVLSTGQWIAISSAASALVAVLCTKGVDAILKLKNQSLAERKYADGEALKGYEKLIEELTKRVTTLEEELSVSRAEHLECIKTQERLKGANERVEREVQILAEEVKALRTWRHDLSNQLHNELLKKEIAKEEQPK